MKCVDDGSTTTTITTTTTNGSSDSNSGSCYQQLHWEKCFSIVIQYDHLHLIIYGEQQHFHLKKS